MEMFTKGIGLMIKCMGKGFTFIKMILKGLNMKGSLKEIKLMEKEF